MEMSGSNKVLDKQQPSYSLPVNLHFYGFWWEIPSAVKLTKDEECETPFHHFLCREDCTRKVHQSITLHTFLLRVPKDSVNQPLFQKLTSVGHT